LHFSQENDQKDLQKQFSKLLGNGNFWNSRMAFLESYASVGDLGETIALLLPSENSIDQSLSVWMKEIIALHDKTDEEKKKNSSLILEKP
jgi:DNA ligase-1